VLALPPYVTLTPPSACALRLAWSRGGGGGGPLLAVGCAFGTLCVWDAERMHAESGARAVVPARARSVSPCVPQSISV
jgi:hypothetical protein